MCLSKNLNNTLGKLSPATKAVLKAGKVSLVKKEDHTAADAAAAEDQRQARISTNVGNINSAFAGRQGQYDDFVAAMRKQYGDELQRQQTKASQQSKFALARGGLTGGSAAVTAGKELGREFTQGTIAAEGKASGALSDLQAKDEQSRLGMISLAQSGSDIGNAATQTANALRANIGAASSSGIANGLGDVFGNTAATYKNMNEAASLRRGLKSSEIYANPFTRGSGAGSFGGGG